MTALADATDPRFTDGQRAHLARFEAAEVPAEVMEAGDVVERVARALAADWVTRYPDDNEPWEHLTDGAQASFRRDARVAIAAMPASPAEVTLRRVEALAEELDSKSPQASAWHVANRIRAALVSQAGEAGQ